MAHDGRVLVKVNAKWQQHSTEHKEDWEGAKVHRTQPCLQLQLYALQCTFAVPAATTTATALAAFSHKHIYANVHKYSIISMSPSFSPPPSPTLALALSTGCHCEFLDSSSESVAALLHLISLWP